jgi:hypothetical protein
VPIPASRPTRGHGEGKNGDKASWFFSTSTPRMERTAFIQVPGWSQSNQGWRATISFLLDEREVFAKESGIAPPPREQLAELERKRAHTGSNEEWVSGLVVPPRGYPSPLGTKDF